MTTIKDVEIYLRSKENNVTALRWLKDPKILQEILDGHLSWNEDHTKFNEPDMVFPLETNVDYYLDHPWLIEPKLTPPNLL